MAQWGSTDSVSNACKWGPSALAIVTSNTVTTGNLFQNTTVSAFVTGQEVGLWGVSATEVGIGANTIAEYSMVSFGSGYPANAAVTITGGGGSGATANALALATGRISKVFSNQVGSAFSSVPTIAIAAPAAITFSGNSTNVTVGNTTVNGFITLGATNTAVWANGDALTYLVAASNTAIGGLANNTTYFVLVANSTAIQLAATKGGAAINLASAAAGAQAGHTLTGETAVAVAVMGGGKNRATAGWNIRKVGTGGRAGRVTFEPLVAMRSLTDGSADDTILPNS
jgi:hypothetical protein